MKKYLIAAMLSFALAMLTVDASRSIRNPVPYVYKIDTLPGYGRRRPLKRHFAPEFSAKLQIS
ncbi:MAG: hypothetical protein A2X61_00150 [Ignavibacteria bacterium GWB2_35_12]|nr:MAG: hypothetical protein A2X63_01330 [Ignavibacteria bacterium GWA2_35_8]OGU38994.1 MAG: hypothetical protein A2X61_00150 [Ignavibacteria bacterium GWB2_35_12]OGV20722.1 MAG: hypothetical protein A2475_05975 [Ignavibacteria bacterium RIFOXYC2_FULL_35_21]